MPQGWRRLVHSSCSFRNRALFFFPHLELDGVTPGAAEGGTRSSTSKFLLLGLAAYGYVPTDLEVVVATSLENAVQRQTAGQEETGDPSRTLP